MGHFKSRILALSFFCIIVGAPNSFAMQNFSRWPGRWKVQLNGHSFFTSANYFNDGSVVPLEAYHAYANSTLNLMGAYNLTANWSLLAGSSFVYAYSNDGTAIRQQFGVGRFGLGVQYLFVFGRFRLAPMLYGSLPATSYDFQNDNVLTSDGDQEITGMGNFLVSWKPYLANFGDFGYRWRSVGLSSLMLFALGMKVRMAPVWFGAEISGYHSIISDIYSSSPNTRTAFTDQVDGGSFFYDAVNPSLYMASAFVDWRIGQNLRLQVNGGKTIAGLDAANGYQLGGAITCTFGGHPSHSLTARIEKEQKALGKKQQEMNRSFVPTSD